MLQQALALWRGSPTAGLEYDAGVRADLRRLEELRDLAVDDRIDCELALGRHQEVVPELEALVTATPLRERRHAQLMRALSLSGRRAESLEVYRRIRTRLVDELGLEPGPELRDLERSILAQDDEPVSRPRVDASSATQPSDDVAVCGCWQAVLPRWPRVAASAHHRTTPRRRAGAQGPGLGRSPGPGHGGGARAAADPREDRGRRRLRHRGGGRRHLGAELDRQHRQPHRPRDRHDDGIHRGRDGHLGHHALVRGPLGTNPAQNRITRVDGATDEVVASVPQDCSRKGSPRPTETCGSPTTAGDRRDRCGASTAIPKTSWPGSRSGTSSTAWARPGSRQARVRSGSECPTCPLWSASTRRRTPWGHHPGAGRRGVRDHLRRRRGGLGGLWPVRGRRADPHRPAHRQRGRPDQVPPLAQRLQWRRGIRVRVDRHGRWSVPDRSRDQPDHESTGARRRPRVRRLPGRRRGSLWVHDAGRSPS